jgi:hypothetical protein
MTWYNRELFAIASPLYNASSEEWLGAPLVCKMIVYRAKTRHGGIVNEFFGRVWPARITNDEQISDVCQVMDILKRDTFKTQAEAEKALFMRKLKGEIQ